MINDTQNFGPSNLPSFVANNDYRKSIQSSDIDVLTDIYRDDINIAIWQREIDEDTKLSIKDFLSSNPSFQKVMTVSSQNVYSALSTSLGKVSYPELNESIAETVDMFCCLFELKRAGLRLIALNEAMCPKFHVDRVPCRLVCTYQGKGTEWLPHSLVDRTKLGKGLADEESGLFEDREHIQKLNSGDVALLKGASWHSNENAGLVHRSPSLSFGDSRLLLTLDFAS